MLGDQPAVNQPLNCKFWEAESHQKCVVTPGSIVDAPANVLGQSGSSMAPVISIAFWGGLAWFLFMRGK